MVFTETVALTGYETVTTFASDFNVSQSFWYDPFLPGGGAAPGTLCDPHVFNVGDSFVTNYTFYEWELVTVTSNNDVRIANHEDSVRINEALIY